jgi:L-fucose mutarotase
MNLSPGVITCAQALRAVLSAVPVEHVSMMDYEREGPYALTEEPPVWAEFRSVMKEQGVNLEPTLIEKWAFYDAVNSPDHILTIQTADQHRYSNILLDIGVRMD